eukprot:2404186-Amphidinium_carterae.1
MFNAPSLLPPLPSILLAVFLAVCLDRPFCFKTCWDHCHVLNRAAVQSLGLGSWRDRFARGGCSDSSSQEALRLILHTARAVTHRGGDVRLATGTFFRPLSGPFMSFDPALWSWSVSQSYAWQQSGHITHLEMVAEFKLAPSPLTGSLNA